MYCYYCSIDYTIIHPEIEYCLQCGGELVNAYTYMKQNLFASAIIVGLIGFLWPLSSVLMTLNSWNGWDQPAMAGQLIRCLLFGIVAFAGAVGINVKDLIGQYIPSFNSGSSVNTVSSSTLNKINSQDINHTSRGQVS